MTRHGGSHEAAAGARLIEAGREPGARHPRALQRSAAGRDARLLHDRGRLAEEHGLPREPKHKIAMPWMGKDLDDFWGREMTIAKDQDMR